MSYAPRLLESAKLPAVLESMGVTATVGAVPVVEPVIFGKERASALASTTTCVVTLLVLDRGRVALPSFATKEPKLSAKGLVD